jgi:hypothetical protein
VQKTCRSLTGALRESVQGNLLGRPLRPPDATSVARGAALAPTSGLRRPRHSLRSRHPGIGFRTHDHAFPGRRLVAGDDEDGGGRAAVDGDMGNAGSCEDVAPSDRRHGLNTVCSYEAMRRCRPDRRTEFHQHLKFTVANDIRAIRYRCL